MQIHSGVPWISGLGPKRDGRGRRERSTGVWVKRVSRTGTLGSPERREGVWELQGMGGRPAAGKGYLG